MDMELVGLANNYAQASTMNSVGTAMLSKTMDAQKTEGAGIVKMIDSAAVSPAAMERSVYPNLGGNFDMTV